MNTFRYEAPYEINGLSWSNRSDQMFRLAVAAGDGVDDEVQIIRFDPDQGFRVLNAFENETACATAVAFYPSTECNHPDFLACATDILTLWTITGRFLVRSYELSINRRGRDVTLTAIEWNAEAPRRIATLCSRGSCAVWDIQIGVSEAQFFTGRRSRFVNDVSWGGSDVFAACFTDGNVKIFDLRTGQDEACIYRSGYAVDKVEWSPIDRNNIALSKGSRAVVLDTRWGVAGSSSEHRNAVKSIAWDPVNPRRLCTAGMDSRVVMWELASPPRDYQAFTTYVARGPIQELKWSTLHPTWAAIGFNDQLQIMEVVNADGGIAF